MKNETPATVEQKKARYRELVICQRKMTLEDQWKMASAIREAKAQALVAIEALRLGQ